MAVTVTVEAIESQLWPQGDIRDPLGIWGCRVAATGTGDGGSVKATVEVAAPKRSAYVYTCYGLTGIKTFAAGNATLTIRARLLTNWPNVDPQAGVQAFATSRSALLNIDTAFSAPDSSMNDDLLGSNGRFILLFDPRPTGAAIQIIELEINDNVLNDLYIFEAYGYFWDRSVLQAPGGPRHPGAS